MRRPTRLGNLAKGRKFWFGGRPYRVSTNLGVAGVSVRSAVEREVTIGDRTFVSRGSHSEVWSAESPVEVEARTARDETE